MACFPELPDLKERGLADGVGRLYARMHEQGELIIAGRRASDIRALLCEVRERWGFPDVIVCDRWREAELRDSLEKAGFPLTALEVRGQGFKDGGEDVRLFREACLADAVKPARSILVDGRHERGPRGHGRGRECETQQKNRRRPPPPGA